MDEQLLGQIVKSIDTVAADLDSLIKSYNSNHAELLQRVTSTERWQESHERLDEERWHNMEAKLSEIKGMLETIPIKIQEDINCINEKLTAHENAIQRIRGIMWFVGVTATAVSLILGLLKVIGG